MVINKFNIFRIINFVILFIVVITILIVNKYRLKIIYYIKNFFGLIEKKKVKRNSEINTNDRVEILMNKYGIKSTEITNNLKYLIDSPHHMNFNKSDGIKIDYLNNNVLKKLSYDILSNNIIKIFIYNKKLFIELFMGKDDKYIISNLVNFYEFQKKNIINKNKIKYNILLKFYSKDKYLYIFVNKTELIKINNNNEYDNISQLLEKKNNIFLIRKNIANNDKYFVTYGDYITSTINSNQLKKTFFKNKKHDIKNYNLLTEFNNINIYFFVCTEMSKFN